MATFTKTIRFYAISLLLFGAVSQSTNAVMLYDITATYEDGTIFMATYDDPDGDGSCTNCSTISAAITTIGVSLQSFLSASLSYAVDLVNLLNNDVFLLDVDFTSPAFIASASEADPSVAPFSVQDSVLGNEIGLVVDNKKCAVREPVTMECEVIDPNRSFIDIKIVALSLRSQPPSPMPEPTTVALMGLGIAGLGFRRKTQ